MEQFILTETTVCAILGAIILLCSFLLLTEYLIFKVVDMYLRVKDLRQAFIKFYYQEKLKEKPAYASDKDKMFSK
jgi:archaellum component FlaF (FlaF/FlaG flagellin family)